MIGKGYGNRMAVDVYGFCGYIGMDEDIGSEHSGYY